MSCRPTDIHAHQSPPHLFVALVQSQKKDLEDREQDLAAARSAAAAGAPAAAAAAAGCADASELAALQEQVEELKWEADDRTKELERLQVRLSSPYLATI